MNRRDVDVPGRILIDPVKGPPNPRAIREAARDFAAHQGRVLAAEAAALNLTPEALILQKIQERKQISFDIPIHPDGPTDQDFRICAEHWAEGVLRRERERQRASLPWWLRWLVAEPRSARSSRQSSAPPGQARR